MSGTGAMVHSVETLGPVPKTMHAGVYREKGIVRTSKKFPYPMSATAKS